MKAEILKAIKQLEEKSIAHGERVSQCANGFIADTAPYLFESRMVVIEARKHLLQLIESE